MSEVVRWKTEHDGSVAAIVVHRGSKWLHVIRVGGAGRDGHVAVERVPLTEERYMRPLTYRNNPYPAERCKALVRARARRCGATKEAARWLRRARL